MPLVNPIISKVAPVKVGGSASAGVGRLVSAFDHIHPLTETSGPDDLAMGSIIASEAVRRISNALVGQQFDVMRQPNNLNSSSTTPANAGVFVFNVRRTGAHVFAFLLDYSTGNVTTGLRLSVNFTGTSSNQRYNILGATSASVMISGSSGAWDGQLGSASVGPAGGDVAMLLYGSMNVTAIGTLALQYASGVAGQSVTIAANGWGMLIQQ
jgi:hypothetical protein